MRITNVYTRTGDDGTTSLSDGTRVRKDSLRIECYGTVDELNAVVGKVRELARLDSTLPVAERGQLVDWLESIQHDLFNLGGDLATPIAARWPKMVILGNQDVAALETMIDRCQERLGRLKEFVLPGGSLLNVELHLARTVSRRAERLAVQLAAGEEVNPGAVTYLNRVSDLFFVLSRWVLSFGGTAESLWCRERGVRYLTIR